MGRLSGPARSPLGNESSAGSLWWLGRAGICLQVPPVWGPWERERLRRKQQPALDFQSLITVSFWLCL